MPNRKLNKATDQRDAMLRNMVTAFLWNGKLVTTESRAKEVRPIAEKLITLAVSEYKNTETVTKTKIETNDKEQTTRTEVEKVIDKPSKLHARRQIMAYLYDIPLTRESKARPSTGAILLHRLRIPRLTARAEIMQSGCTVHLP